MLNCANLTKVKNNHHICSKIFLYKLFQNKSPKLIEINRPELFQKLVDNHFPAFGARVLHNKASKLLSNFTISGCIVVIRNTIRTISGQITLKCSSSGFYTHDRLLLSTSFYKRSILLLLLCASFQQN